MSQPLPPKLPNSPAPKPTESNRPNPKSPKPNLPPVTDPGKRTGFGDKKGGPGTNNTGAKK